MADELSQVQGCVDQLATQMFACLHWVSQNSIPGQIEGQSFWPPEGVLPNGNVAPIDVQVAESHNGETQNTSGINGFDASSPSAAGDTDKVRREYQATLRELAQDLVVKEQQIESIIKELPGLDRGHDDQQKKMQELEEEAKQLERQASTASDAREELIKRVEETIMKVRRV